MIRMITTLEAGAGAGGMSVCLSGTTAKSGVTTPDWSIVTSNAVRDALAAIFESCDWEHRWAGLDEAQDRTRRAGQDTTPKGFRLAIDEGLQMGMAIFVPLLASPCATLEETDSQ